LATPETTSKSKCYLCWLRRRLPQRIYKYASLPPSSRLDIIFDLEVVKNEVLNAS
jgi:hypothetical protein